MIVPKCAFCEAHTNAWNKGWSSTLLCRSSVARQARAYSMGYLAMLSNAPTDQHTDHHFRIAMEYELTQMLRNPNLHTKRPR